MTISTRLTEFFQIRHPVVLAPMTPVAGGELAAAVSAAGAESVRKRVQPETLAGRTVLKLSGDHRRGVL